MTDLRLDNKALGHLRHMHELAVQLPGEWAYMGISEPDQEGDDALRYQLAFMTYAVGVFHYHYTPAWPEFSRHVMRRFIDKMLRRDVFGYWTETSKGAPVYDPDFPGWGSGWRDPVREANVMYSGHILQMISMYEVLFGDGRFDGEGSITFPYDTVFRGLSETFEYDHRTLAARLHEQFVDSGYEGVCCELNAIFAPCNQHLVLGLLHFDHTHGSTMGADVAEKWLDVWDRENYVNPATRSVMHYRQAKQRRTIYRGEGEPWADGWTGTFMHAWAPERVEELYPIHRERHLKVLEDGSATVRLSPGVLAAAADLGHMATYAAELGDSQTRDAILAFADRELQATWRGHAFYYERNDDTAPDAEGVSRYVNRLTGNALLPLARINVGNGLREMYRAPWSQADRERLILADVDFPTVIVVRAHSSVDSLFAELVSTEIGTTTVSVVGLAPQQSFIVRVQGHEVPVGGSGGDSQHGVCRWLDGKLQVELELTQERTQVSIVPANR